MKLSVVIPAYNEEENLPITVPAVYKGLEEAGIEHEILVVNDNSKDNTIAVLDDLKKSIPTLRYVTNPPPRNGFGYAVRCGLENFEGDCVAVFMGDLSDSPQDLVKFYHTMVEGGYDAVFGTRWSKGGQVFDYPRLKKIINRVANWIVKFTFRLRYDDCTNAFKLYRKETIEGLKPFLSPHFNLTLELPLKVIIRGYSYDVVPNTWTNRTHGVSKLKIREMGSRYFFVLLYCLIEKFFSKGDFRKKWDEVHI